MFLGLALSAVAYSAEKAGCYETGVGCACDVVEADCTFVWTEQCSCDSVSIEPGCGGWNKPGGSVRGCGTVAPSYRGPVRFADNVSATVGDFLELSITNNNLIKFDSEAADVAADYDNCNLDKADLLQDIMPKTTYATKYTFHKPGTYYFTTTTDGGCAAGLKAMIIVGGTAAPYDNKFESNRLFASKDTHTPGTDDDWEAFGKGVFHEKAYDDHLHKGCEEDDAFCLDNKVSKGSCYYAGTDFHIGHAVFCDVAEIDCCGYVGCGAAKGVYKNGDRHSYYWYAPGYTSSRDNCCHCMASCDTISEDTYPDTCAYRDVTSKDCQRNEDRDSLEYDTIGFLQCEVPQGLAYTDAVTRPEPSVSSGFANVPSSCILGFMAALGALQL